MGSQHRSKYQGNDGHQLQQDVHSRSGSIFERIAYGVAGNRCFVRVGTFAAVYAGFNVLLRVIPSAARIGHHNSQQYTGSQRAANHSAQSGRP